MANKQETTESFNFKNLRELTDGPPRLLVHQLGEWGILPKEGEFLCNKCDGVLRLMVDGERNDGLRWYCGTSILQDRHKKRRIRCVNRIGLRTGTFFSLSRLSMFQILAFVYCWVSNIPLTYTCQQSEISEMTAREWNSYCRKVIFDALVMHKKKLGGVGKVVEIHESKYGQRKYHRGRHVEGQWVFGGYERGSGNVFMVCVDDCGDETLLPIIQEWIEPGTTIISNCWRTYNLLSQQGYEHLTVNHSVSFRDPETGADINAVELSGLASKATFDSANRKKNHIPRNLALYMFYKRCAELKVDRFFEFLRLAGQMYNPMNPPDMMPQAEEDQCTTDTDATDSDAG